MKINKDWVEAYFEYGVDVQNRKVFLFDAVEAVTIGNVIKGLYLMDNQNNQHQPIELFIGSFGGNEYEMFALYDVIRTLKSPIHTTAIGKCMSAAPLLVACGEPGHRYATPNTWFMVHQSWDDFGAKRVDEFKKDLAHYDKMGATWYDLMEKHTVQDAVFWRKQCEKVGDSFFDAETALAWGLVDQIWEEK
jgi:ATP-dependent Clp protease protease subunit